MLAWHSSLKILYIRTVMKNKYYLLIACLLYSIIITAQRRFNEPRQNVPLDSIILSDPFILADKKTSMYYMTGTGGLLWKSKDMKLWDGPFRVTQTDSTSWMGPRPQIWAAEIHAYKGKYYYFATFTNQTSFFIRH